MTTERRDVAAKIVPGDTVTVYAHPAGKFGRLLGADVTGTVESIRPIGLPFTTRPGFRIRMDDRTEYDAVCAAVTVWHDEPRATDSAALLAEYDEWAEARADLSMLEDRGDADADDWQASDDKGCDLANRLAAALLATLP